MRRPYRRYMHRPVVYPRPVARRRFVRRGWRPFIPWIGLMSLIAFLTLAMMMFRW